MTDLADEPRASGRPVVQRALWRQVAQSMWLAARAHRHDPSSLLFGALTLALGFGAAAANYSARAGFTRPLPVPDGAELVRVELSARHGGRAELDLEEATVLAGQPVFARAGAFTSATATVSVAGRLPVRVGVAELEPRVFETLQVQPLVGRLPASGSRDSLVIGEVLWQNWFERDPGALGSTVEVDGVPRVVVAVMPAQLRFPSFHQVWTVLDDNGASRSSGARRPGEVVGRLLAGVSRAVAAQRLQMVLRTTRAGEPEGGDVRVRVLGYTEDRGESGELRGMTALLFIVVALLLVSSTNVSSLLRLRGQARARALSVHRALGARPGEIVLQVLAESLVIAVAGAAGGLVIAWMLAGLLEAKLHTHWGYPWMDVRLQPSVLVPMGVLAVVVAVVAGTWPAVTAARSSLYQPLKQQASVSTGGRASATWAALCVQVALSAVALAAAILLAVGLVGTRRVGGGIDPDKIVLASVRLEGAAYERGEDRVAFWREAVQRLEEAPELRNAAVSSGTPLLTGGASRLRIEGQVSDERGPPTVPVLSTSANLFDLYGLAVGEGELFDDSAVSSRGSVAVVSAGFASRYLDGRQAVGRRIALGDGPWLRIVGVVSDLVLVAADREREQPVVYVPLATGDPRALTLSAWSEGEAGARAIESIVHALDPGLPLVPSLDRQSVGTLESLLSYLLRLYEVAAGLAVLGGAGAALVVIVGLYGVLAFEVQQRRRELGIRQALGADRLRLVRLVLLRALWRLAPGLVVGLIIAWFATPLFGVFLSGIDPHDPRVFAGLILLYGLLTLLAAIGPGHRAVSSDPVEVLRVE